MPLNRTGRANDPTDGPSEPPPKTPARRIHRASEEARNRFQEKFQELRPNLEVLLGHVERVAKTCEEHGKVTWLTWTVLREFVDSFL